MATPLVSPATSTGLALSLVPSPSQSQHLTPPSAVTTQEGPPANGGATEPMTDALRALSVPLPADRVATSPVSPVTPTGVALP